MKQGRMRKQDVDSEVLRFFKETEQQELFDNSLDDGIEDIVQSAYELIRRYGGGDIDKAIEYVNSAKKRGYDNLFS